jgi:hypothetical protein
MIGGLPAFSAQQPHMSSPSAAVVAAGAMGLMQAPPARPLQHRLRWSEDAHDQPVDDPADLSPPGALLVAGNGSRSSRRTHLSERQSTCTGIRTGSNHRRPQATKHPPFPSRGRRRYVGGAGRTHRHGRFVGEHVVPTGPSAGDASDGPSMQPASLLFENAASTSVLPPMVSHHAEVLI